MWGGRKLQRERRYDARDGLSRLSGGPPASIGKSGAEYTPRWIDINYLLPCASLERTACTSHRPLAGVTSCPFSELQATSR